MRCHGVKLPAPANLNLAYEDNILTATWDVVPEATGYQVQVLDDQGTVLDPQPKITITDNRAVIDTTSLEKDKTYQAQVKATVGNSESASSNSVSITLVPPSEKKGTLMLRYTDHIESGTPLIF